MDNNINYIEPGVYVKTESAEVKTVNDYSVQMYPLFIGRAPSSISRTLTIIHSAEYVLTSDTKVVSGKKYYTYNADTGYTVVSNPTDDDIATYYEAGYDKLNNSEYSNITEITRILNAYNSSESYSIENYSVSIVKDSSDKTIGFRFYSKFKQATVTKSLYDSEASKYVTTSENVYNVPLDDTTYTEGTTHTVGENQDGDVQTVTAITVISVGDVMDKSGNIYSIPAEGNAYKITFNFTPTSNGENFKLQEFSKSADVRNFYGSDTIAVEYDENGIGYNPLPIASAIAEEIGCKKWFCLRIEDPQTISDQTLSEAYTAALDTYASGVDAAGCYRIIPLNQGEYVSKAAANHVTEFSSDEERMECGGFYSIPYDPSIYTTKKLYANAVSGFASKFNSARSVVSYGSAARYLTDGTKVKLHTQFLLCAVAAMENIKTDGTGLTNALIPMGVFDELDVPSLRRSEKNIIASNGVLIFEQEPSYSQIKIRHALTTMASNPQWKEMVIMYNIDYVRKYLRKICNPYIGRRNITTEVIELVNQTLVSGLSTLVKEGRLASGVLDSIGVSEDADDTLVVILKVKVAYPLNYIYITLVLE